MSINKKQLMDLLTEAVWELYAGVLVFHGITETGFYCDFDLSEPINPAKINALNDWLHDKPVACFYELSGFSGAYLDGDASRKMLQRIYVTAFDSRDDLRKHREKLLKAAEHDHKRIGSLLGLFSTSEDIGQGLPLWYPKGATVRFLLEQFSQAAHLLNGYQWVYPPHIGRSELWKTSGHLENFRDAMYNPITIEDEEYYLKPINCPFHFVIYNSQLRSYRDLPMRLAEFGIKKMGLRVEADYSDTHMREKIKRFEAEKIPYIFVVGDKDVDANGFSVRSRRHGNLGVMNLDSLSEHIKDDIEQGKPKYIFEGGRSFDKDY